MDQVSRGFNDTYFIVLIHGHFESGRKLPKALSGDRVKVVSVTLGSEALQPVVLEGDGLGGIAVAGLAGHWGGRVGSD
jgi:hypothetical protein